MPKWLQHYINRLAFNNQKHPIDPSNLTEAFVDSNGLKYFKYDEFTEMPIVRLGKLHDFQFHLQRKLDKDELELFLNALTHLSERILDTHKYQNKYVVHMGKMAAVIDDMRNREENLLHPELLFDMVAITYIREDENPAEFDNNLHKEKVLQFKKDSVGGLYDFFYNAGMDKYFTGFELLKEDLDKVWEYSQNKTIAQNAPLYQILSQQNFGEEDSIVTNLS